MSTKMTTCNACGEEIARSARACPHCGAKQGLKGLRRVINYVVGGFIVIVVIGAIFRTEPGTPACDSASSKDLLTQSFDESQYARTRNLSAVEVTDISEQSVSNDQTERTCTATVQLNNAGTLDVEYDLRYREDSGDVLLEFRAR